MLETKSSYKMLQVPIILASRASSAVTGFKLRKTSGEWVMILNGVFSILLELLLLLFLLLSFTIPLNAQDSTSIDADDLDTLDYTTSKSGYDNLVVTGGASSVDAELKSDDDIKHSWLDMDKATSIFKHYYNFKRKLNENFNIAVGIDYMFLNQYASFSYSDVQANSGIFRFFGTWVPVKSKILNGALVFKIENRHKVGHGVTPRNLGYETGSALSTASFKDFYWGLTNFYWKQTFDSLKYALTIGIMDTGDWIDLFPLLNPFKYYLNESFFNSPAMALPDQGLGIVGYVSITKNIYAIGGIQDANGEPQYFFIDNINSFFNVHEYFQWIEIGWNLSDELIAGETIHLTYWHQDSRTTKEIDESYGFCFSASTTIDEKISPFIRAAISEGNAAVMHHIIMVGLGISVLGYDYLGIGISWGAPVQVPSKNQWLTELFYGFQITDHLNIAIDVQSTFNPSFNDEKSYVGVYSAFRFRYAL